MICLDWPSGIIQFWFHRGNLITCFVMEDFPEIAFRKPVFNFLNIIWSTVLVSDQPLDISERKTALN